jgi:hypothetical protein
MTPTTEEFKKFEVIEKWKLMSALSGINANNLWSSADDETEEMLEKLETIEQYNSMLEQGGAPLSVALNAIRLGISSNDLYSYQTYQDQLAEQAEEAARVLAEQNNTRIKNLRDNHGFKFVDGPSRHQLYWEFTADLGQGPTLFKCRYVTPSWFKKRIWREWIDSSGKKQQDKFEYSGNHFVMDHHWPAAWREQYRQNFTRNQIPHVYTHEFLIKHLPKPKKAKNARKSNSTV